ncbi:MAG: hypothetical protein ACUZ8N_17225 [Candidatus Scalindua sp.]
MKITNTNQQIIKKPELSKADTAENLAGKKKSDSKVAAAQSAAIKTDTVQLSQKSIDLARAAKSDSGSRAGDTNKQVKADGKTQTHTVQNIDENVLAKLLKMADKRSGIFGSSGIDASKESGEKIDYFL